MIDLMIIILHIYLDLFLIQYSIYDFHQDVGIKFNASTFVMSSAYFIYYKLICDTVGGMVG